MLTYIEQRKRVLYLKQFLVNKQYTELQQRGLDFEESTLYDEAINLCYKFLHHGLSELHFINRFEIIIMGLESYNLFNAIKKEGLAIEE